MTEAKHLTKSALIRRGWRKEWIERLLGAPDRVFAPPAIIRNQHKKTGNAADDIVGLPRFEERPVSAIMGNDKNSHEKPGGENGHTECRPIGDIEQPVCEPPECEVWKDRVSHLEDTPEETRRLIRNEGPQ